MYIYTNTHINIYTYVPIDIYTYTYIHRLTYTSIYIYIIMHIDAFETLADPTRRRIVAALRTGEQPVSDIVRHGSAVARLGNATAIFVSHAVRFFQESSHLIPYHLFQLIAAHGSVVAHRLAIEPVTVRTGAAIIAQRVHRIVCA